MAKFIVFYCILVFKVIILQEVNCHLDVFISNSEVMKLMGVNNELFYVRNGVVSTYAMNFIVNVPSHISNLEWSWQSLTNNPLLYTMTIEYNGQHALGALLRPKVNISDRGYVPTSVQTFRVDLPCTGLKNAEIEIQLLLNITSQNKIYNDTFLNFKRNKICLKDLPRPQQNETIRLAPGSSITSGGTFYVAVGCALVMITVVLAIISVICIKSKKVPTQESLHTSYTTAAYGSNHNVFIRFEPGPRAPSVGSGSYATIASIHKVPIGSRRSSSSYVTTQLVDDGLQSRLGETVYYASSQSQLTHLSQVTLQEIRPIDIADRLRHLKVPRCTIELQVLTQEGTFGRIYRGAYRRSDQQEEVTIKTVSDVASSYQVSVLLTEGTMMFGVNHKNILPIIAVNTDSPKQPLLIYPHTNKGNLKRFLIRCRQRGEDHCTLLTKDLVDMAVQISSALVHLHSKQICHKDIATRNCVVDEYFQVKVTDNALSRDLFPNDYYCLGDNENRPVKWLAHESLAHKQFNGASDIWSFGVLLWELTTLAQQPYVEVDPFEMTAYLRDGYRLAQPINCPDELFDVIASCWSIKPEDRPTSVQILSHLQYFYAALGRYV